MAKLTPQEFQEKHARRLKAAIGDMQTGVGKVTVSPPHQAAAKIDKMQARLMEKFADGTIKRRLLAVSVDSWKNAMITKGLPRVAQGIDGAAQKVTDFAAQLLPAVDAAKSKIVAMPDLTIEDSINRMTTYVREMAKFRKK